MTKLFDKLAAIGCNVDNIRERFLDDDEFYISCLDSIMEDEEFERLGKAIEKGDVSEAFDCAHALKGVIANMELKPMYDIIVRIVEPLRAGKIDVADDYKALMKAKSDLAALIAEQ